jgi:NAD dependent epimerase/dehydratase
VTTSVAWKNRTVLITGAGGFIGSHLTERLVQLGAKTRALVRYNSAGNRGWLECSAVKDDIEFILGDVRDPETLCSACRHVDVVFHLAALISIPYSYGASFSYVQTNIEGTLNVLQAARESGAQRVVHTSTSEVYGTAQRVPISEDHPLVGQSPYSASKIGADKLAESFFHSFDLPVSIVRPFNTFGPRQSARAVIPTIIGQALRGEVVRLGRLTPTRDLNFVADTVDGFVEIGGSTATVGKTLNIGSGREISIGELAHLIFGLLGQKCTVEEDQTRLRPDASEVDRLLADSRLARDLTGWHPQYTLEQGLIRTIEWMRSNLDKYRTEVYAV